MSGSREAGRQACALHMYIRTYTHSHKHIQRDTKSMHTRTYIHTDKQAPPPGRQPVWPAVVSAELWCGPGEPSREFGGLGTEKRSSGMLASSTAGCVSTSVATHKKREATHKKREKK